MQITEILAQIGGLKSIANELNISQDQAASGAEALLPAIIGGFKKQVQTGPQSGGTGDMGGLGGLLGQLGGSGLLDDVLSPEPTHVNRGNDVLGQIFGSKDVSRTVAQNAASQSGLDSDLLKKMLPMLAMLVTGFMAKRGAAGGDSQGSSSGGGLGGLLGGLLGGQSAGSSSGLGAMLDLNGDGNALDDILRMAGKAFR
ncbi:DUF937 domain-containing protein [Candidimonas sp. SYP-B2681]|uniref:DUF937 domain-containing protein n=1 Tax=Candidimonas sp. SYP-B2681 TaxID=2497686 RepID=UPI000F8796AA|nr:DUF937 domain-containing protein [Candidimonas sp. SYP-B2681]RTZ45567.1 DUF937 domain-containing protein [Candidimonas sp. SYP-B2681]